MQRLLKDVKEGRVQVILAWKLSRTFRALKDELDALELMKAKGAHASKMAVMPNSTEDVLTLLEATDELYREEKDMVIVTMSMGSMGLISRLGGGVFGSTMTFGARNELGASAPGQIEVGKLKIILNIIENR